MKNFYDWTVPLWVALVIGLFLFIGTAVALAAMV